MNRDRSWMIGLIILLTAISGCGGSDRSGANTSGPQYTLTVQCEGNGKVMDQSGYAIVTRNYAVGSTVTLVPSGEGIWVWKSWSGEHGAEVVENKIVMNGNKNITANFSRLTHNVTISTVGEGTVTKELVYGALSSTMNFKGEKIKLTPVPKTGWDFDHWEGDVPADQWKPELTVDSDKQITAVFSTVCSYKSFNDTGENQSYAVRSDGVWQKTTNPTNNQERCWGSAPNGFVVGEEKSLSLTSRLIDLKGSQQPYLIFDSLLGKNTWINQCSIEISDDGGAGWKTLEKAGGLNQWETQLIDLAEYKNKIIQVRFRYTLSYTTTNSTNTWYVDNISIKDQCLVSNYFDNAESDQSFFISNGMWSKSSQYSYSGQQSWLDRIEGNTISSYLTSNVFDLTEVVRPYLCFYQRIPYYQDNNYIQISADGGKSWTVLKQYNLSGNSVQNWAGEEIDLSQYKHQKNLILRFKSENSWGQWYIDDIGIYDFR